MGYKKSRRWLLMRDVKAIGFIGLGVMGLPMALNILKCGLPVFGFDVSKERRNLFQKNGGIAGDDCTYVFTKCELIFICLPSNETVKETIEGFMEKGQKDSIMVDLSSTAPSIIFEMSKKIDESGKKLLDSPVSGGEIAAIAGTLVLMCGGDKEVFDLVKRYLSYMGKKVTYMGKSGCGSISKLANNMIVGINLSAIGEAFAFAKKAGIDSDVLFQAIKDGYAGSIVMNSKIPKIISRDFSASARTAVHMKDLKNATQLANEMGVELPLTNIVFLHMQELESQGSINEDHCALAKIYEQQMGVEIKADLI